MAGPSAVDQEFTMPRYRSRVRRFAILISGFALPCLAGCANDAPAPTDVPERDPVAIQALNDQILTDPDLSIRNEANAALTTSTDHSIPPVVATREAVQKASADAKALLGGITPSPVETAGLAQADDIPTSARISLASFAALIPGARSCADRMDYTARWAVDWGGRIPIYPRANLREAAGIERGECDLRAISFLTPVMQEEVAAFYAAMARKNDLALDLGRAGDTFVLIAKDESLVARVHVARTLAGVTRVDIALRSAG